MRFLYSLILVLGLAITPVIAHADTLDVRSLSAQQIADLNNKIVELKAVNNGGSASGPSVEQISAYAELGKNIGVGLSSAAHEMGVAVNDFAQTSVGKWAMFIIVYNLIGGKFISIGLGLLWFSTLLIFWTKYFKRICLNDTITETFNDAGKRISRVIRPLSLNDDNVAGYRIVMFFLLVVASIPAWILVAHGL